MVWIFSKTQCLIFFFPLLHSTNELVAPPEVGGHCKNVLTSDLTFLWPEQSVWHMIRGSGWLQWAVQCVLQIFFTQLLAGPQATAARSIDSFTCISNLLCVKAQSITGNLPLAINSHWLADWLDSHAASLWKLIGLLEMQETAHMVTLKKTKKLRKGKKEVIANLSGFIQWVSSPPLSYPKLHLTSGSLNGPIVILIDNSTAEYNEAGIN